jgi:hypothetical protein
MVSCGKGFKLEDVNQSPLIKASLIKPLIKAPYIIAFHGGQISRSEYAHYQHLMR